MKGLLLLPLLLGFIPSANATKTCNFVSEYYPNVTIEVLNGEYNSVGRGTINYKDKPVLNFETGISNGYGGQYYVIRKLKEEPKEERETIAYGPVVSIIGNQLSRGTPKKYQKKKVKFQKMEKSLDVLKRDFQGLRTGRASVSLLEPIGVEAYGSKVPINQVGNISISESRLITVQVWDESLIQSVEKAIRNSDLGLNPMIEGNIIRVPIPELSQERRVEIVKIASKYAEDTRVTIRNIRRDAMDKIKEEEKQKNISKDDSFQFSEKMQKITNDYIERVDTLFHEKEKDILKV